MEFNSFLSGDDAEASKGGGRFLETPGQVENIVFQTRGGPLSPFEQTLSEQLMAVFAGGATALPDVVAGLVRAGSVDGDGLPWTETGFTEQMARSAGALFAHGGGSNG